MVGTSVPPRVTASDFVPLAADLRVLRFPGAAFCALVCSGGESARRNPGAGPAPMSERTQCCVQAALDRAPSPSLRSDACIKEQKSSPGLFLEAFSYSSRGSSNPMGAWGL